MFVLFVSAFPGFSLGMNVNVSTLRRSVFVSKVDVVSLFVIFRGHYRVLRIRLGGGHAARSSDTMAKTAKN